MKPSRAQIWYLCTAYVVLHTLAHILAYWFDVAPGLHVSIWYAPCGLAISLLVLLGPRYAWLVFLANFATSWITQTPRVPWTAFFFPGLITANYTAAAWYVRRSLGPILLPGGRKGTQIFCLVVGGAPLVVAIIGTAVVKITYGGVGLSLTTLQFLHSALDWWIGDASGLLTVVPVVMVFVPLWLKRGELSARSSRSINAGELALAAIRVVSLLGSVVLILTVPVLRDHSAFYICFLPLVWICVNHGLPGATLATLLVTMVGLISMRLTGTTVDESYVFLLFEVAVAGVGLGLGTLVTHRNEAERRLATSQAQLGRVIAGAQLGLWDWDIRANRVEVNERLAGMLGYRLDEIEPLHERWPNLVHPSDYARTQAALADHLEGKTELYEAEFRLLARDGGWRWVHSRGSVVKRDEEHKPLAVSGTHIDVTDRKRAEAEVDRLLRIIEATPDFVVTTDSQGRLIYANAAMLSAWTNSSQESSRSPRRQLNDFFPGDSSTRIRNEAIPAAIANGSWQGEITLVDSAGRTIPTSLVLLAHHDEDSDSFTHSFIMRDISAQKLAETERVERERRLLNLQKNESLGILAGGVAHDFNNLLTAVVGNSNLARFELSADSTAHAHLTSIEQAATRASALCHQMLAYAGRNSVAFAEVDLNKLIEQSFQLLSPGLNKKITIQFELHDPLGVILAENTQMQQVITNLTLNAADAIGHGEGRLTVRTSSRSLTAANLSEAFPDQQVPTGTYTILEIEDTGCGMTPEVQARIFEPFFTTKFIGQGLGLAAVIGVVKSHRGAIAVRSSPGKGSTFRVAFPAIAAKPSPESVPPIANEDWRGSGLVLVVDDDEFIQEVAGLLLKSIGFTTLPARDGVEGVELFRQNADRLRCVLLDLSMPRMDGFEAHAKMHEHNPTVPVILISGYSQKLDNLPPDAIHPAGVMAKPFGIKQLRSRLESVLTTSGS